MSDWKDVQFDARGRLVDVTQNVEPGPPPDTTWTALELWAITEPQLFGKVVAVSDHRGIQYSLVVVSDIFSDDAGTWVRVVTYDCFFTWVHPPPAERPTAPSPARAVRAKTVWVGHDKVPETRSSTT